MCGITGFLDGDAQGSDSLRSRIQPTQVWPWVRDKLIPHQSSVRKRAQELGLAHFSLKASVDSYLAALNTDKGASCCRIF